MVGSWEALSDRMRASFCGVAARMGPEVTADGLLVRNRVTARR